MFSFIYFILAFHLRKEFLHTPTTLNSASSQPTPPFCIWNIKIFSRPDFGVLNGFLQSFDHSREEAWPGVLLETSGVGGGAPYTPQGGNTPVHDIAIFLRIGSISFFPSTLHTMTSTQLFRQSPERTQPFPSDKECSGTEL